jgi:hypothetical protein
MVGLKKVFAIQLPMSGSLPVRVGRARGVDGQVYEGPARRSIQFVRINREFSGRVRDVI